MAVTSKTRETRREEKGDRKKHWLGSGNEKKSQKNSTKKEEKQKQKADASLEVGSW